MADVPPPGSYPVQAVVVRRFGAVGGYALELAGLRGLRTIAVAAARDEELVRRLGACF